MGQSLKVDFDAQRSLVFWLIDCALALALFSIGGQLLLLFVFLLLLFLRGSCLLFGAALLFAGLVFCCILFGWQFETVRLRGGINSRGGFGGFRL